MNNSAIEKIKQLEEQKAVLADEAKKEAVAQAQEAVNVLEALGYKYALVREEKQKKGKTRRGTRKPNPNKVCTICNFQTAPPHDARHHRNQAEKAPLTPLELEEKGLTMVNGLTKEDELGTETAVELEG